MSFTTLGHEEIRTRLERALARGRLGQAYLFVGPKGIGKRRFAREFAKALLCSKRDDRHLNPCNECADCHQVDANSHPDVFEIAKAIDKNQLPIEEMKDLCARLTFKAVRGKHKIAIVDDADALNEESANCFLKTLEEPPAGSVLIMIAESIESQLPTIVSRCQPMVFRALPESMVEQILLKNSVCKNEREAQRIARFSGGSIGKAMELSQGDWQTAREMLLDGIASLPSGQLALSAKLNEFMEEAGKESAQKRARGRTLARLAGEFLRDCLAARVQKGSSMADRRLKELADRLPEESCLDMIERTMEVDFHLARFLNQSLVIECWIDDLAQLSVGKFLPSLSTASL